MTIPLTPTEQRIIDLLADGMPHHRREVSALLNDDMALMGTLRVHLHRIRQKIRPSGHDVITEVGRGMSINYRFVRLVGSAYNGYR